MKQHIGALLLSVLAISTTGCPADRVASTRPAMAKDPTALVHEPSGVAFPPRLGVFTRERALKQYANDGSDVSAAYNYVSPYGAIAATTYVYPSPRIASIASPQQVIDAARDKLTQGEFARCKQELQAAHPQAEFKFEKPFTTESGRAGLLAEYEYTQLFAGITQPLTSRIYLFTYFNGRWTVMHRITYTADSPLQSHVHQYVRDFDATMGH